MVAKYAEIVNRQKNMKHLKYGIAENGIFNILKAMKNCIRATEVCVARLAMAAPRASKIGINAKLMMIFTTMAMAEVIFKSRRLPFAVSNAPKM